MIKIAAMPNTGNVDSDKLIFSYRTAKLLRLSKKYTCQLINGDFLSMPANLIKILLKNELIVPAFEVEKELLKLKSIAYKKDGIANKFKKHAYSESEIILMAKNLQLI